MLQGTPRFRGPEATYLRLLPRPVSDALRGDSGGRGAAGGRTAPLAPFQNGRQVDAASRRRIREGIPLRDRRSLIKDSSGTGGASSDRAYGCRRRRRRLQKARIPRTSAASIPVAPHAPAPPEPER